MSQDLEKIFLQKSEEVKNLAKRPDNETLLSLYALFKQASQGDVSGSRPGIFDLVNRKKFDAWTAIKGTSKDQAMQKYIELVSALQTKS